MTEVTLDVETIPTVPEKTMVDQLSETCQTSCENTRITCRTCFSRHSTAISCTIVLMIMVGVVIGVVLSQKTVTLPCMGYTPDTLASSVSVGCLQYVWNVECSSPYTFSPTYSGWWNQSPQGGKMVAFNNGVCLSQCGVGSYSNILIYMQFCNIRYGQY